MKKSRGRRASGECTTLSDMATDRERERKDRLIQTRVPRDLEATLKKTEGEARAGVEGPLEELRREVQLLEAEIEAHRIDDELDDDLV